MPDLTLDDDGAGQSPAHRLGVSFTKGQLEIYRATVQYPVGFEFNGFDALGPPNSQVGIYALDLNDDGAADVSLKILSAGVGRAYVDVIADGAFSPDLEPSLSISRTAEIAITFPLGGDALSTTIMVPWDARAELILFAGLLANPATSGRYDIDVQLVSVDPDTDGPDDGMAPDPLEVEVILGVDIVATGLVPFTSLRIDHGSVRRGRAGRTRFSLRGRFELGANSDGIDPTTEGADIRFDTFTQHVEGASIHEIGDKYIFLGRDGVKLLYLGADGTFFLLARSDELGGLNLASPVLFGLQIGDDFGEVGIPFSARGHFPARAKRGQREH